MQRLGIGLCDADRLGELVEADAVRRDPRAVRTTRGEVALDLLVLDHAAAHRVDDEHAARLDASLGHDTFGRHVERARLGGEDDEIVIRHDVARGTEAVAIERRRRSCDRR